LLAFLPSGWAATPPAKPACRAGVLDAELQAGKEFRKPIGNGLELWFQPIASGWILRVVPETGPVGDHDYAELATPPYESVSPLSLSTDFAFRAQDAVGWNPRRFQFATSPAEFDQLDEVYQRFIHAGATPPAPLQLELSDEVARASGGKLTILDARLIPGVADQGKMAAAVSSNFATTAHTLVQPADGKPSALGKLLWLRVRVELALPPGFRPAGGIRMMPTVCGNL